MFSYARSGSVYPPFRKTRHAANSQEGNVLPVHARGSGAFASVPPARVGGAGYPGGLVLSKPPHPLTWALLGLECANASAALSRPPEASDAKRTIHVINLDSRADRWGHVERLGVRHHFALQRFSAIRTRRGWVGCARSHLKLIREAADKGLPYVIVAEDDFLPSCGQIRHWEARFAAVLDVLEAAPDRWQVFNSFPSSRLFGQPTAAAELCGGALGIREVNGGHNTHLMVYSAQFYPVAQRWEDDLKAAEAAWRPGKPPIEHTLAWDVWISARADSTLTVEPRLTVARFDDSDIVAGGRSGGQRAMHAGDLVAVLWERRWLTAPRPPAWLASVAVEVTDAPEWRPCALYGTLASLFDPEQGALCAGQTAGVVLRTEHPLPALVARDFALADAANDSPWVLRLATGWIMRRPVWLAVRQAQLIMEADESINFVLLNDTCDAPAGSKLRKAYPTVRSGVHAWDLELTGGQSPCICRRGSTDGRAVILPGAFAVRP